MDPNSLWRRWPLLLFTLIGLLSLACSSASTPTSTSPQQASTSNAPTPTRVPGATPTLTPAQPSRRQPHRYLAMLLQLGILCV